MYFRHELDRMAKDIDPLKAAELKSRLALVGDLYDGKYLKTLARIFREVSKFEGMSDEDCLIGVNEFYYEDCYSVKFPELNIPNASLVRSGYISSNTQYFVMKELAEKYGVKKFEDLKKSKNEDAKREYKEFKDWSKELERKQDIMYSYLAKDEEDEDGFFDS